MGADTVTPFSNIFPFVYVWYCGGSTSEINWMLSETDVGREQANTPKTKEFDFCKITYRGDNISWIVNFKKDCMVLYFGYLTSVTPKIEHYKKGTTHTWTRQYNTSIMIKPE